MSRLIDRNRLIMHLHDYQLQESHNSNVDGYEAIGECIKAVEEQPTAYDPETLVSKLLAKEHELIYDGESYIKVKDAVRIVKEGFA